MTQLNITQTKTQIWLIPRTETNAVWKFFFFFNPSDNFLRFQIEAKVERALLFLESDSNKHSHFLGQKLNVADIRALNPTEVANKSLLVLTPEATLCAACGIAVSFALPLLTQRCWIDRRHDCGGERGKRGFKNNSKVSHKRKYLDLEVCFDDFWGFISPFSLSDFT